MYNTPFCLHPKLVSAEPAYEERQAMLGGHQSRHGWLELLTNTACSDGMLISIVDITGRHLDLPVAASHNGCIGRIGKMWRSQPVHRVPLPFIFPCSHKWEANQKAVMFDFYRRNYSQHSGSKKNDRR